MELKESHIPFKLLDEKNKDKNAKIELWTFLKERKKHTLNPDAMEVSNIKPKQI